MTRIVLVNPPLSRDSCFGKLAKAGGVEIPWGLCYLAAAVRSRGFEAVIIDAQASNLDVPGTVAAVLRHRPDCVGITAVTCSMASAGQVARLLKGAGDNLRLVLGGVHVTSLPEDTLRANPAFDAAVIGEGEVTLGELLDAWEKGLPPAEVPGLAFLDSGRYVLTAPRERVADLDTLPVPAIDLLPPLASSYHIPIQSALRYPAISLVTSRGCAGRCSFCDRTMFGNRITVHSAEYIAGLLKKLRADYGIRTVHFPDDNFVVPRQRLLRFAEIMRRERIAIRWSCLARIDAVDESLLAAMRAAGCWQVLYGIESGSDRMLRSMDKGITRERIVETLRLTRRAGLRTKGFFMVGMPGETAESLAETRELAMTAALDDISITYFTPFHGSSLSREVAADGAGMAYDRASQFEIVYVPAGLTADELGGFVRKLYRDFYLRPRLVGYYFRRMFYRGQCTALLRTGFSVARYFLGV